MRAVAAVCLLLALGCGDQGLRDRSLMGSVRPAYPVRHQRSTKKRPSTAVIGLDADPLAQYYAENAPLIVRFNDFATLKRDTETWLGGVRARFPELGLPDDSPIALVRKMLDLPDTVPVDPLRPFALVRFDGGWVGVLPIRDRSNAGERAKALDAIYSVAGDPGLVATYEPSFRKGFFLPGHCSVIAQPGALADLGTTLTEAATRLGVDLRALDGLLQPVPGDIERVDIGLRFGRSAVRVDLRASPNPQSPTALALARIKPATPSAIRWLPSGGTLYVESLSPPLQWESLLLNMARDLLPRPEPETEANLLTLRRLLASFGAHAAAMVELGPDGSGKALLVAHLEDPRAAREFFVGEDRAHLLQVVAGPDGRLAWNPHAFDVWEVPVGSITGHIGRDRLLRWRQTGAPLLASLATLLRGPVVTYVAVVDDKLCIVVGQGTRADAEKFIEHVRIGTPVDNDHNVAMASLFPQRIAAVSGDLANLFEGCREAAPHWHPRGRLLRELMLPVRLPAGAALTVEGGALRLAVRFELLDLCDAIVAFRERVAGK